MWKCITYVMRYISIMMMLGKAQGNHPPWPGATVTICMCCFMTGGPGKEHGTNKPPPTGRVQERSKGDTTCQTTSQNPSHWLPSWLSNACTTRKDSESDWLIRDHPETIPITIKPKTVSHIAEQFSWVPLPLLSAWVLLPNKIFFLVSTCISSDSSFLNVRQELNLGPGKGPPSWNNYIRSTSNHQALDPGCWGSVF